MGIVQIGTISSSYKIGGYRISQLVYCIYCDKCGSFKINRRPILKNIFLIILAIFITSIILENIQGASLFAGLFCFSIILLLIGALGGFNLGYICIKCGNMKITFGNTKNYIENDYTVLDVPYEKTKQLYWEE
jgi:hypothetical protein